MVEALHEYTKWRGSGVVTFQSDIVCVLVETLYGGNVCTPMQLHWGDLTECILVLTSVRKQLGSRFY